MLFRPLIQNLIRKSSSSALLSEQHRLIRDTCCQFANKNIKPFADEYDRKRKIPREKLVEFAESGILNINVREDLGGLGKDTLAYAIAVEEISCGCASMGVIMSVQNSLYAYGIQKWGTEQQINKFVKEIVSANKLGCFALTEPGNGSDAGAANTTAVKNGDYYILNGTKFWISNATISSAALVFASTDPSKKNKGISAFLVPIPYEGLTIGKGEETLGIKASVTAPLIFEDCKIPIEFRLGEEGQGFKIAMNILDGGRIGVGAQAIGIARAALECAIKYSLTRKTFGKPISEHQSIQNKIADMATRVQASRLLIWDTALLKDNKLPYTKQAAMCKLMAAETATFVTHEAIQILGGMGYSCSMPTERHYRDARITEIYEGTSEIQRIVIAQNIIKEFNETGKIE